MRRGTVAATLMCLAGGASLALARPAITTAPRAPDRADVQAAALAMVDIPAEAATTTQTQQLGAELSRLIASPGWRNAAWSVLVVSLETGDTLFAYDADRSLAPASNMKLFTSAAGLYYLGEHFRYITYLVARGRVVDGVLDGDLIVYGTGDPTLSDRMGGTKLDVWNEFAAAVKSAGIREVRGAVIGDASYFTGPGSGTGWKLDYVHQWYAAPASALSFAENVVTLRITPAAEAGWRPDVLLVPGGRGIALLNQAVTVAAGRTNLEVTRPAYDAPILVTGRMARGAAAVWRAVPVASPGHYAAAAFVEVLQRAGIAVRGGIGATENATTSPITTQRVFAPSFTEGPPLQVLTLRRSPPLVDMLAIVNKRSHNLYAEQVLRTVGRVVSGQGSAAAGAEAVHAMLERELGHPVTGLDIDDGSGLSVQNRAAAGTIVALLAAVRRTPVWAAYLRTLPEAGERGLRRMGNSAAIGNLRAKTGTIDSVSALSGYVTATNGETLAFSILSNNVPSTFRAKRIEDAIGTRLAGFTRPWSSRLARGAEDRAEGEVSAPQEQTETTGPIASPATPGETPTAASDPAAADAADATYVIQSGDTMDAIARRHGISVTALQQANPGVNPRRLQIGQRIRLPG
ncbi:MAG: D-alanyl-D-alanine carboxypeptidase/D-alanyl-D-alanine endopeptidase [Longimicrobiales bacterium]